MAIACYDVFVAFYDYFTAYLLGFSDFVILTN